MELCPAVVAAAHVCPGYLVAKRNASNDKWTLAAWTNCCEHAEPVTTTSRAPSRLGAIPAVKAALATLLGTALAPRDTLNNLASAARWQTRLKTEDPFSAEEIASFCRHRITSRALKDYTLNSGRTRDTEDVPSGGDSMPLPAGADGVPQRHAAVAKWLQGYTAGKVAELPFEVVVQEYDGDNFLIGMCPRNLKSLVAGHEVVCVDGTFRVDRTREYQLLWVVSKPPSGVSHPIMCGLTNNEGSPWTARKVWEALRKDDLLGQDWCPRYVMADHAPQYVTALRKLVDEDKRDGVTPPTITRLTCLYHVLSAVRLQLKTVSGAARSAILDDLNLLADCGKNSVFEECSRMLIESWSERFPDDEAVSEFQSYMKRFWMGDNRRWYFGAMPPGTPRNNPVEQWHRHTKSDTNANGSPVMLFQNLTSRHFLNIMRRVIEQTKAVPAAPIIPQEWQEEVCCTVLAYDEDPSADRTGYSLKRCGDGRRPQCLLKHITRYRNLLAMLGESPVPAARNLTNLQDAYFLLVS
jgi:transposase-like protein